MKLPDYFKEIKPIIMFDELAKFLGTSEDGLLEYRYSDIVKMAGHSCAIVSGAYIITRAAMKILYGSELPQRGNIKVEIKNNPDIDNAGVTGSVISNITGAAYQQTGFSGIQQGRFNRRNQLIYGAKIDADVRFTRLDTLASVKINYKPGKVVEPKSILMSAIGPSATIELKTTFPQRWQQMVKTIFDNENKVIEIIP